MKRLLILSLSFLALVPISPAVSAQEAAPPAGEEEAAAEPLWTGQIGLSYLATSGNSDSETFGVDLEAARRPIPWGLEVTSQFNRAEQDGLKTAERYFAGARATRRLTERWHAFGGVSFEQDEFSGIDLRTVFETGASYTALTGPPHILTLDFALTLTDEDRLPPTKDDSWLGALLALAYKYEISDNATFSQGLRYYPNFAESDEWRAESLTALTAAINARLAMRLSYEIRYRNLPLGANDDTDTTAKASLVWSM